MHEQSVTSAGFTTCADNNRPDYAGEAGTAGECGGISSAHYVPGKLPLLTAQEVADAATNGYDIEIVDNTDTAYRRPQAITEMFGYLDGLGKEYEVRLSSDQATGAAGSSVFARLAPGRSKQEAKALEGIKEALRYEMLFHPTKGEPWHEQRGCATALLTIQEASNLQVTGEAEGEYPTMSAMLDESVIEHRFGEGSSLSDLSLPDAIINAGKRFYEKDAATAQRYADRQLARLAEFINAPVTARFKDVVVNCMDSLGIRARKEIVRHEIAAHMDRKLARDPGAKEVTLLSIGCGTALPIFEVARDVRERGLRPRLILLDQDPIALAGAVQLSRKMGLEEAVELHCERLFSRFGKPIDLEKMMGGRQPDVIEDSGLREYLPDRIYKALATESWQALAKDGIMTTGNMNTGRPQAEFLHGLMGWAPKVQMRTIDECLRLHRKAGIPRAATKMRVTKEGVYTIYVSEKQSVQNPPNVFIPSECKINTR